ncbi:hypothetical protein QYM36_015523 [Artemia franciscana]|uniref:Ig-like domain-containing protein n=1 Tax=Artemia franciscana TaxID=6661 RepID=A0AA88HF12_ARTSF|nr:hypothetical protein QYM36_015523 [Artemia franciscana]
MNIVEPLFVTLELPQKPLIANQTSDIKCRAVGSRPAALLSWWIAGKQLIKGVSTKNTDDGNMTVSILSFIPDSVDDGKHITCRVENPMLPGTALEDTSKINVQCKFNVY